MTILNPITWGKASMAVLIGAIVFGVVYWLLTMLHMNVLFGLNVAVSYAAARWAETAVHAMTGGTPANGSASARRF